MCLSLACQGNVFTDGNLQAVHFSSYNWTVTLGMFFCCLFVVVFEIFGGRLTLAVLEQCPQYRLSSLCRPDCHYFQVLGLKVYAIIMWLCLYFLIASFFFKKKKSLNSVIVKEQTWAKMLLVDYYILDFSHSLCPAALGTRGVIIFSVLQTGKLSIGRMNFLSLHSGADVAFKPRVVHFYFIFVFMLTCPYISTCTFKYYYLHWFYYGMCMFLHMCGVQGTAYEFRDSNSGREAWQQKWPLLAHLSH